MVCWRARSLLTITSCLGLAACSLIVNTDGLVGPPLDAGSDAAVATDAAGPTADGSALDSSAAGDAAPPGKITPRATATGTADSASAIPIALPSGARIGDTLVASVFAGNNGATTPCVITPSFAWTQVARVEHGTVGSLVVYTHVVDGTEPLMMTFGITSGSSGVAWITDYGGIATKDPVDDTNGADLAASTATYDAPAVQAKHAGDLVLVSWGGYSNTVLPMFTPPPQLDTRAAVTNHGSRAGAGGDTLMAMPGMSSVYTANTSPAPDYAVAVTVAFAPGP